MNKQDPDHAVFSDKENDKPAEVINDEKFELISGYLDEELTQQEAQKISLLIKSNPEYKRIYDELSVMRIEVQSLSLQERELDHLDKLINEPVSKTSRILGFTLAGAGVTIAVFYTLYKILIHPELGLLEKVLVGAMSGGTLLLLFSVLRQRLISARKDKYKRVKI